MFAVNLGLGIRIARQVVKTVVHSWVFPVMNERLMTAAITTMRIAVICTRKRVFSGLARHLIADSDMA